MRRIFVFLMLIVFYSPHALYAGEGGGFDLQAGVTGMEGGDDRYRAGVLLHLAWNPYAARYYYFEQDFGPVQTSLHVITMTRSFALPSLQSLSARVGVASILEHTRISFKLAKDQSFDRNEYDWNGGLTLGVYWHLHDQGPLTFQMAWDSAIFPAGLNGGILLATGRKHLLSISAGMHL